MQKNKKEIKTVKKCPFKIGDEVEFAPDERTIGWYQHSFERLKIHLGYKGTVMRIKDDIYLYLDDDIGGFPWTSFKRA